jgi:hypothetical protein
MTTFALIALALIAWCWFDGTAARERVLAQTRRACEDMKLLLLDQSVVLEGMSVVRRGNGRLGLRRAYRFEFSFDGEDRRPGRVALNGGRIEGLNFSLPDGVLHLDSQARGQVVAGPWSAPGTNPPPEQS